MLKIISPIAIDMGAKYTGVYLTQYEQGDVLENANPEGLVVMHTENMQYSQVDRTQRRHQTRTAKRRKMAKRLLWLVLAEHYNLSFKNCDVKEREAINSLLNRRGFTYLSEDVDEALLQEIDSSAFHLYFNSDIPAATNLFEVYQVITTSVETAKSFQNSDEYAISVKDFSKRLEGDYKEQKKQLESGFKAFRQGVDSFINAEQDGHKIRSAYLANIKKDLSEHEDYQFLRTRLTVSIDAFSNFVGHISNLQLRVLRRYFNDENMAYGDIWDFERLHKVFYRNVSGMHYKDNTQDKQNQVTLFSMRAQDIISTFEALDPIVSIPPFEDQNNRRPPKCQSLKLSPTTMIKYLPKWHIIVPQLADDLEARSILVKDGLELNSIKNTNDWAQCLQRILELSYDHDPYLLRRWIGRKDQVGEHTKRAISNFERVIQQQHHADFIVLAELFYAETQAARNSIWFKENSQLLEVCAQKTPHKANQFKELLSGTVNVNLTEDQKEQFEKLWFDNPRIGKRGIKGWCGFAAEMQKEYGNALKEQINRNIWLNENDKKVENKKLIELNKAVESVAKIIADSMNIESKRFANVFDLAKLHNLVEKDQKGFSNNCRCCTKDNAWRGNIVENDEGKDAAFGLRLPADTTRPFDGLLARLIDKQAYQIAQAKVAQLLSEPTNEMVSVPLLIEENKFRFTSSLAEVKKNTKKRKDNEDKAKKREGLWLEKNGRIKEASKNICPYTDKPLYNGGEIDHIISRAESKGRKQTVFNHEANLIYCSVTGNGIKDRQSYSLADLKPKYLTKQFETSNREKIKQRLIALCEPIIAKRELGSFGDLNEDTRQAIRHGLFVDELRPKLIPLLHQSNKTRVNGTQAYLAKLILQKIKLLYKGPIEFSVHYVEAELASRLRVQLGNQYPEFAKPEHQPVASHVIDAAMVMAAGLQQPHTQACLQTAGLDNNGDWLKAILPTEIDVKRIEPKLKFNKKQVHSQTLFKDGIYAEHVIPLVVNDEKFGVGFTADNVAWLKNQEEAPVIWWNALQLYLNKSPETLDDVRKNIGNQTKVYSFNNTAVFELLYKVAKQPCSDEELLSADLLETLIYTSQKVKLQSALYDENNKTYKKITDIVNMKTTDNKGDFTIKLDVKSRYLKTTMRAFESSLIVYPAIASWSNLLEHDFVKAKAGKKEAFDSDSYNRVIKGLFSTIKENTRQHKKVRKNWSLPKLSSPSGGYRARRKNADGSIIWQLFAVEGLSASGFYMIDGKIDFSEAGVAGIKAIDDSKNLTSVKSRYKNIQLPVEPFDNWRRVTIPDKLKGKIKGILLSPNSKSRFRVRIEFSYGQFKENVLPLTDSIELVQAWSQIPAELKMAKGKEWKASFGDLIGTPRSNLFTLVIGTSITLEYIVGSSNTVMKQAYQNGSLID